jgi:molybdenum cofactor synthesis domain-containing protein
MENPSAAIIIIGNEILSGRTQDTNSRTIILALAEIGIIVKEIRVIPDVKQMIAQTIQEIQLKYAYIFTTGGIGPTHDDITSESVASALAVPYVCNLEIYDILRNLYNIVDHEMSHAQKKMAYVPEGSKLIYCSATKVPGFNIQNIYVLAGVPRIMKSMLESILPDLAKGKIIQSKVVDIMVAESKIADQFELLQQKYPEVEMGSYPFDQSQSNDLSNSYQSSTLSSGQYGTSLVLRSSNYTALEKAYRELTLMFKI